jgi:predicted metal-binding membrane protein
MDGMDGGPWTNPGAFGFYISTWIVMMAAMMLPSLAPAFSKDVAGRRAASQNAGSTHAVQAGLFVFGYLAAWGAVGLIGYGLIEALRSLDGGLLDWSRGGRWSAAAVLLVGSVYQFTPAKRACLERCRSARTIRYRAPHSDELRAGIRHGVWCLGCCWGMMVALFALGAMSVAWMVVISVLIACERLLPSRKLSAIGVAVVLAALALGLAVAPSRVPMLRIPDRHMAMEAMSPR